MGRPAPRYGLIVFDFDGTLADSFGFFVDMLDILADTHGFRRLPAEELDALRGADAGRILQHVGLPLWKTQRVARHYKALMAQHIDRIELFDGMESLLQGLAEQGSVLAIVSSNSRDNVLSVLGPGNARLIHHYECGATLFGKRRKLRRLLATTGIGRHETLCIGDEIRDIDAAHDEGLDFAAVGWGYTRIESLRARSPRWVFDNVEDMAEALLGPR